MLAFDERKIIIKLSSDSTSKTNKYIVLHKNYFHYGGSPIFSVPLNPYFTFPFEENYCQSNYIRYFGSPIFPFP